ncbi:MAG: SET domain-containing protein-lysine N-methyltransferase [Candidatus Lokiarchaeota archaeon]|nr:SET domain-containing protein-lysine N-methyltransferase [Candidatus Lokiarchaeota archaeon]
MKFISIKKGRGVFAKKNIAKEETIDVAHILLISNNDWDLIEDTVLSNYSFEWDDPKCIGEYESAISLSVSQLINHSYDPNVKYVYDYKNKCIEYITLRDISKGEEITVNYNGESFDYSPMSFDVE